MNRIKFDPDPLFIAMTLQEVIEETGRARSTVLRWIREGRLPKYTIDGEEMFVRRDVLKVDAETARRKYAPRGAKPKLDWRKITP